MAPGKKPEKKASVHVGNTSSKTSADPKGGKLAASKDRICCLHEQFDEEILTLPDPQRSTESINNDIEDFYNKDPGLKLAFLRLSHLTHITMLLILTYFFNVSVWYLIKKKALPRIVQYKLSLTLP